ALQEEVSVSCEPLGDFRPRARTELRRPGTRVVAGTKARPERFSFPEQIDETATDFAGFKVAKL
ncbi:MAG TPA: hypothetical protein VJL90_03920, partial [Pseudorhodoplanes sp.]|nr:hypothetical protein [Pseudorhodoplanes sp.]